MLIPYTTDAPVYHFPFGTIGLIIANVLMFLVFCADGSYDDDVVLVGMPESQNEGPNALGVYPQSYEIPYSEEESEAESGEDQQAPEVFVEDDDDVRTISVDGMTFVIHRSQSFSRNLLLDFGDGWKPWQWLSAGFMHDGWMHLISNMIFLWSFGLVIEGKVGALLFIPIYLFINVAQGCLMQTLMLFADGGTALGASSAIFGLLALVVLWAPINEFGAALLFGRIFIFDIPHLFFGFIYVMLNGISIFFSGTIQSSAGLHMTGFLVGLPIGLFLLVKGYVDCEGYDLISYFQGKQGKEATVGKKEAKARRRKKREKQKQLEAASPAPTINTEALQQQVSDAIDQGNLDIAIRLQEKLSEKYPGLPWRQSDLKRVVVTFLKQRNFERAFPLMELYIQSFPDDAFNMQVLMAKVWLQQERPKHTLRYLQTMNLEAMDEKQRTTFKSLVATAKSQLEQGVIEI